MLIICMQVYYAIAQPLLQQQVRAEELQRLNKPIAETTVHCTQKRKLEECRVDYKSLQDHTESMASPSGPAAKRVACASDVVPQEET